MHWTSPVPSTTATTVVESVNIPIAPEQSSVHLGEPSSASSEFKLPLAPAAQTSRGEQERNVACYFGHLVHSAWVLFSWLAWRHHPDAVAGLDTAAMCARLEAEQTNLAEVAALLERDSRLGFYEEAQRYYVTPDSVRAKRQADAAILTRLR